MKTYLYWLILLIVGPSAPLWSAAAAPGPSERGDGVLAARPVVNQRLTLDETVTIGLRESPLVRGAAAEIEGAIAQLGSARAERLPWLSTSTFLAGGGGSAITSTPEGVRPSMLMNLPGQRFFDQNLNLMVPVFTGGRLEARVRRAQALRGASQADLEGMRQETALLIRTAYREALARKSLVDVYQATLGLSQERLRVDQASFEAEKIPHYYVLRDQAEVANTEQMVTNAQRDRETSLIQLKTVMGVNLASRIDLAEPLGFEPSEKVLAAFTDGAPADRSSLSLATNTAAPSGDPALARLLAVAERRRPELAASFERVDAGRAEVRAAQSAFLPQISMGLTGDAMRLRSEPSKSLGTIAVVASLPLFDAGWHRDQVRAARAERQRAEADREQLALKVGQEVATALLGLRAAEKNVATAQTAVTAAEEDYRVALLRYTSGKGINVEALDALAAQVRAQSNAIQALFDYNVAQDQLARAIGVLTPSSTP